MMTVVGTEVGIFLIPLVFLLVGSPIQNFAPRTPEGITDAENSHPGWRYRLGLLQQTLLLKSIGS